ncbi:hypothetical protein ACJX0J_026104, partial [Zea mays]
MENLVISSFPNNYNVVGDLHNIKENLVDLYSGIIPLDYHIIILLKGSQSLMIFSLQGPTQESFPLEMNVPVQFEFIKDSRDESGSGSPQLGFSRSSSRLVCSAPTSPLIIMTNICFVELICASINGFIDEFVEIEKLTCLVYIGYNIVTFIFGLL